MHTPPTFSYIYAFKNIMYSNYSMDSEIYTPFFWYSNSAPVSKFKISLIYLHLSRGQDMASYGMVNHS